MENTWKNIRLIDKSDESGSVRPTPPSSLKWLAGDISDSDWKVELPAQAINEILHLANNYKTDPHQASNDRIAKSEQLDIRWPTVQKVIADLKDRLDNGRGFAVIHGLPIDKIAAETLVDIYWLLGQEVAPPVAQKWNGEMIYSVKDTGQKYTYGVRGSRTSVELVFHVDNAFGLAVPDYVGLLCKQPAKQGGISRFCSLYTVHERLSKQYPDALARLYQPMLFDRQKEHADNAPAVLLAPFFSWKQDKLTARANTSLVRKGYEVAEVTIEPELDDALSAVTEVCKANDLWYEAPLERGHIQYLNNHEIAHYRSEFEDFDEPEKKRHLYRLWHRQNGSQSYDGVAV